MRQTNPLDICSGSTHDLPVISASLLYGGQKPEDVPAYPLTEVATIACLPASTLRSWVMGRSFPTRSGQRRSQPVIRLAKGNPGYFSFTNLVEVHVLAAMRRKHALKLAAIRTAVRYVRDELQVEHPLATEEFKTNGVELFVERLGHIINASKEGQLGMKQVLNISLERIEYADGRAARLFPWLRRPDAPKNIVIDPRRAFGRPIIAGTSVPVADIRSRFDAGDSVTDLSRDFDVTTQLIDDALRATLQAA